jgi:hypothetical protein
VFQIEGGRRLTKSAAMQAPPVIPPDREKNSTVALSKYLRRKTGIFLRILLKKYLFCAAGIFPI